MRLLVVLLCSLGQLSIAQTSYDRLAATAKLWAYIKYIHPRATATDVDWDQAFATAAPAVLNAKTDDEFAASVDAMLSALKDPVTRVTRSPAGQFEGSVFNVKKDEPRGVTVVRLERADVARAVASRNSLSSRLAAAGPVVFDLRGSKLSDFFYPAMLPVPTPVHGLSLISRRHEGYASPQFPGNQNHSSSWDFRDAATFDATPGSNHLVFLVNRQTTIPLIALAIQDSGAGAIVSEDPISNQQVNLSRSVPVMGELRATVLTREIVYHDGAAGIAANVVLSQTGDRALAAAAEIARTGNWPTVQQRSKFNLANANFLEKSYSTQRYPSREFRMLAAARIWGVFHYFHVYKQLYDRDWDTVLVEFLKKFADAENNREYEACVAEMVSHTHDTHAVVSRSLEPLEVYGQPTGVEVRWIENRPVVTRVLDASLKDSLKPGDIVFSIDEEPVQKRIDDLSRFFSESTPQAMMNRVMSFLLSGPADSSVRVVSGGPGVTEKETQIRRSNVYRGSFRPARTGDVFRLINAKVGYVDLERLTNDQVDEMFSLFSHTEAIIMDMRGYPQNTGRSISSRLTQKSIVPSPEFRRNLVTADTPDGNPVTSIVYRDLLTQASTKPRYSGKTVMLMDERALSQSEHTGMGFRAANGTIFVGSQTAGVDGEAVRFFAPGGITIGFSATEVRWPDGRQLQRIGLQPDVEVRPTIEGIRAGKDEVMERAVVYIETGR